MPEQPEFNNDAVCLPALDQLPSTFNNHVLNGANGTNREKIRACQINASNDYEAIQCWLQEYRAKANTFRAYQKETERFLLWSIYQCRKPLSSITREDFENYFAFLDNPQPRHIWCGKVKGRKSSRGREHWRPFSGPLSHSAKMTTISVLDSLFNYLVDACYLNFNPLSLMRRRNARHKHLQDAALNLTERMLTIEEWHVMLDVLEQLPQETLAEKNTKQRLTFIIHILYFLGLRINELATHSWNAFRMIENEWWFYVFGKGDKVGRIPVNDALLRAMIQYRAYLKKTPYPDRDDHAPIIASFTTGLAITPRQINKLLKHLALITARRFKHEPNKANKIKKFSAHWLRHFSASMQDHAGVAFKHIRANHRHENDETTRKYVHALDKERHQDMQKLSLRIEHIKSKDKDFA